MIRINLIPFRTARREQQIMQHISAFIGVVVLAALLALAAHTIASLQLSDLKEHSIVLQQQNDDLKKKIGKIDNLDNLRADVERKLHIVDQLQEGRFRSLETLHVISGIIPQNVWLKSAKSKNDNIELSGYGESNKAIANFMRGLDHSAIFTNVRLGVINRVILNTVPVRSFSLKLKRISPTQKSDTANGKAN